MVTVINKKMPIKTIIKKVKQAKPKRKVDLTQYAGKINWDVDPIEYQRELRSKNVL